MAISDKKRSGITAELSAKALKRLRSDELFRPSYGRAEGLKGRA